MFATISRAIAAIILAIALVATSVLFDQRQASAQAGPLVLDFVLFDAGTNAPVRTLYPDHDTIVLAGLDGLNIAADTIGARSVSFRLDGVLIRTESNPPFLLGSDNNEGDVYGFELTAGRHQLTATPYSGTAASGEAGTSTSIDLTVIEAPTLQGLLLSNSDSAAELALLRSDNVLDLKQLPRNVAIEAGIIANPGASVSFQWDDDEPHVENNAPFSVSGDGGPGRLRPLRLELGRHTLRVTVWSGQDGTGVASETVSLSILVIRSNYVVNTTADGHDRLPGDLHCEVTRGENDCSLRAAIEEANAVRAAMKIGIATPQGESLTLELGPLEISSRLSIRGNSYEPTTIDAHGRSQILIVKQRAVAHLHNLRLVNGDGSLSRGGAVHVAKGHAYFYDSEISDNQANIGGGIAVSRGFIKLTRTRVNGNRAGHGIASFGGGGATQRGGGIWISKRGVAVIDSSEILENEAIRGGGISNYGSTLIINSTIARNRAGSGGGAIENIRVSTGPRRRGNLVISYSTITENLANQSARDGEDRRTGGGVRNIGGRLRIGSSIVAGNSNGFEPRHEYYSPDCYSTVAIESQGSNVIGVVDEACNTTGVAGDRFGTGFDPLDPQLQPNNDYYLPRRGSPATDIGIDVGGWPSFNCPDFDQTGDRRPLDGNGDGVSRCDAGAIEVRAFS
ncbi:MAG: CSLREA domain-containing protein [Acidimicrobiales bacterium]